MPGMQCVLVTCWRGTPNNHSLVVLNAVTFEQYWGHLSRVSSLFTVFRWDGLSWSTSSDELRFQVMLKLKFRKYPAIHTNYSL